MILSVSAARESNPRINIGFGEIVEAGCCLREISMFGGVVTMNCVLRAEWCWREQEAITVTCGKIDPCLYVGIYIWYVRVLLDP